MNITRLDMGVLKNFKSVLDYTRFPGLASYKSQIDSLDFDAIQAALDHDPDMTSVFSGGGLNVAKSGDAAAEAAAPHIQKYLDVIRTIREKESEYLKQEPLLSDYLSALQDHTERSLSDREDALDPYRTQLGGLHHRLLSMIDRIPTRDEMADDQSASYVFDTIGKTAKFFGYETEVLKQLVTDPDTLDQATYNANMSARLKDVIDSLEDVHREFMRPANSNHDLMKKFCAKASNADMDRFFKDFYHQTNRYSMRAIVSDLKDIQTSLDRYGTSVADCIMLQEAKNVVHEVREVVGVDYERLESKTAKDIAEKLYSVDHFCQEYIGSYGFHRNTAFPFMQNVLHQVKDLAPQYQPFGDQNQDPKFKDCDVLLRRVNDRITPEHGLESRVSAYAEQMKKPRRLINSDIKGRIEPFYEMMKNTKSGWLGHSNSKEYQAMMNSIESVMKIIDKPGFNPDSMSELEIKKFNANIKEVERTCKIYLEDKIKERKTETGKDRYAGAVGILEAINPEAAEKVMQDSAAARKKPVTLRELEERATKKSGKTPSFRDHAHELSQQQARNGRTL